MSKNFRVKSLENCIYLECKNSKKNDVWQFRVCETVIDDEILKTIFWLGCDVSGIYINCK